MSLEAEQLLAATGLIRTPDQTSLAASKTLLKELATELIATLERENQARLRVNDQTEKYLKKLAKPPDYDACLDAIEPVYGRKVAAEYQLLHTAARQYFLDTYPAQEVDTARGTRPQPPDPEKLAQWLLEVDTVENQRIISDLAAGAVLDETVTVFKTAFPEMYGYLVSELHNEMASRPDEWMPSIWLEMALATFTGKPQVGAPAMEPIEEQAGDSRAKLDLKSNVTPVETAMERGTV